MEDWREEFNGYNGCHDDVHVLDTQSMTWIQPTISVWSPSLDASMKQTPVGRSNHTMEFIKDRLYLFGGCNGNESPEGVFLDDLHTLELSWLGPPSLLVICMDRIAKACASPLGYDRLIVTKETLKILPNTLYTRLLVHLRQYNLRVSV